MEIEEEFIPEIHTYNNRINNSEGACDSKSHFPFFKKHKQVKVEYDPLKATEIRLDKDLNELKSKNLFNWKIEKINVGNGLTIDYLAVFNNSTVLKFSFGDKYPYEPPKIEIKNGGTFSVLNCDVTGTNNWSPAKGLYDILFALELKTALNNVQIRNKALFNRFTFRSKFNNINEDRSNNITLRKKKVI